VAYIVDENSFRHRSSCDMKSNPVPAVIAVVDDDKSVRSATASSPRSCGWTVKIYASGNHLLSEIELGDVRLVIADVETPIMDGFTFSNDSASRIEHRKMLQRFQADFRACRTASRYWAS